MQGIILCLGFTLQRRDETRRDETGTSTISTLQLQHHPGAPCRVYLRYFLSLVYPRIRGRSTGIHGIFYLRNSVGMIKRKLRKLNEKIEAKVANSVSHTRLRAIYVYKLYTYYAFKTSYTYLPEVLDDLVFFSFHAYVKLCSNSIEPPDRHDRTY